MKITWKQFIKLISTNSFELGPTIIRDFVNDRSCDKHCSATQIVGISIPFKQLNIVLWENNNVEIEVNDDRIILNTDRFMNHGFEKVVIRLLVIKVINLEEMFLAEEARVLATNQDKRNGVIDQEKGSGCMDSAKILSNDDTTGWGGCGEPLS